MCNLTNEQMLRYELLKAANYDVTNAKKCYDFVAGNEPEPQPENRPATELADGIYLMYGKQPVAYKGQELSENDKEGCTGIGVKFGGKSLVLTLFDIGDDDRTLTTEKAGNGFGAVFHTGGGEDARAESRRQGSR